MSESLSPAAPVDRVDLSTPGASTCSRTTRRVLHVINGEHYSGAERVQDLLAQELPNFGFEVTFACVKPGRFPEARACQTALLYRTPMRGRFDLACGRRIAELVRQEDYALVHAHTPRSLKAAAQAARIADVPLVYHVHSPTARDSTRWLQNIVNARIERWLLRRAARLICVSPSLQDLMIAEGFPASRVRYVANGVPAVEPKSPQRPAGRWTVSMAALFRPRKGIEVLLEALALLRGRGQQIRFRAIGPFETAAYQKEVHALADGLGLAEHIRWTGFVSDVHAELRKSDLFILPSLFGEGLPMVVLEALAMGLPIVASDVEGVPAAVRHGQEGLLVPPNNPESLAAAIAELTDPMSVYDYADLCASAHRRHAKRFSTEKMAQGLAEVYDEILG